MSNEEIKKRTCRLTLFLHFDITAGTPEIRDRALLHATDLAGSLMQRAPHTLIGRDLKHVSFGANIALKEEAIQARCDQDS